MTAREPVHSMTPTFTLEQGEAVQDSFTPDRATYWRDHAKMAAAAMALGMVILWVMGNPHLWTGAVGGLAAIAIRAFYIASDELAARWDLTNRRLLGPGGRAVRLGEIAKLNRIGSAVQIVTHAGDKHLIKYQADGTTTRTRIERAMVVRTG
ncbi:MAG: hypothetical protein ACU0B7_09330 [Paracoccaceae bacterium]|uniref:hypothetical protein n=1 Tax=Seohaeicola saemankumensis TaxID=481181 RepID=UPI001E29E6E5|nr:hypothetical protein [Seohaeicola saemankumensis]